MKKPSAKKFYAGILCALFLLQFILVSAAFASTPAEDAGADESFPDGSASEGVSLSQEQPPEDASLSDVSSADPAPSSTPPSSAPSAASGGASSPSDSDASSGVPSPSASGADSSSSRSSSSSQSGRPDSAITAESASDDASSSSSLADDDEDDSLAPLAAYEGKSILTYMGGSGTIITGGSVTFSENGVTIQPDPSGKVSVPADASAAFQFDFAIPANVAAQIKAGDYYDIQLPPQFKIGTPLSNIPLSSNNTNYGTLSVGTDGKVRISFTDKASTAGALSGDIHFSGSLDPSSFNNAGDTTITIPGETNFPPVSINVRPYGGAAIDKQGSFDREPDPTSITWTIDVNKNLDNHVDLIVADTLPGAVGAPTNLKAEYITVDLNGNYVSTGAPIPISGGNAAYVYDAATNSFTITFVQALAHQAVRITYETPIVSDAAPAYGGSLLFPNTATLTSTTQTTPLPATATLTASYTKPLQKQLLSYNSASQEAKWQVYFDAPASQLVPNVGFDDFYNSTQNAVEMEMVSGSPRAYEVRFDARGHMLLGDDITSTLTTSFKGNAAGKSTPEGAEFRFDPKPAGPVVVQYTTKAAQLFYQDTRVTNNAVTIGSNPVTSSASVNLIQPWLQKRVASHSEGDNSITWQIDVNKGGASLPVNTVITDTFGPGYNTLTSSDIRAVTVNPNGAEAGPFSDYTITPAANDVQITLGSPTSSWLRFYITTTFAGPPSGLATNSVGGTFDGNNVNVSTHYNPTLPEQQTGAKSGSYNPYTKQITWQVLVNYDDLGLKNSYIEDTTPANQSFVAGSARIYTYTLSGGRPVKGTLLSYADPANNLSVTEPSLDNNRTLTVRFPDEAVGSGQRYMVEFETTLDGTYIGPTYANDALLHNDYGIDATLHAEVSVKRGDELVNKFGSQGSQGSDGYAWWTIEVNASQSTMEDVEVTDTLSANQSLVPSSIKVRGAAVDPNGNVLPDDGQTLVLGTDYTYTYTLQNGNWVLSLKFAQPISKAYVITFKASIYVDSDNPNNTVSNQVSFHSSTGGGTIRGSLTSLTLQKLDLDQTPLPGARFQLYDRNGDPVGGVTTSGPDGTVTYNNLVVGQYTLEEVTAPAGFVISQELGEGIVLDVAAGMAPVPVYNAANGINLSKTDADNNPVPGAEFMLEEEDPATGEWSRIRANQRLVTGDNGWLYIDQLVEGQYRFTEITAPAGYILNTQPILFQVKANPDGSINPVLQGPLLNYKGAVELTKKDTDGNTPATRCPASASTCLSRPTAAPPGLRWTAAAPTPPAC